MLQESGLWGAEQDLAFPLIVKTGVNPHKETVRYYFNYSDAPQSFVYPHGVATELLSGKEIQSGEQLELEAWGERIVLEAGSN
ncbi:hypothetical protein D3C79_959790 [compost metagenome]